MAPKRVKSLLWCTALAVSVATQAAAQDKRALVIADDITSREVALQVSETLLGLGFIVHRLETPSAEDLASALADLNDSTGVSAVYYAGESARLADFTGSPDVPRFVFLDACVSDDLDLAPANTFVATQGADCNVALSEVVLDRLTVPGLGTDQWDLAEVYRSASTLETPYVFRPPTSDVRLTADDYAMLDALSPAARNRMIALWQDAGIVLDIAGAATVAPVVTAPQSVVVSPVRPVAPTAVVSPITPQRVGAGVQDVTVVARPQVAPEPLPFPALNGGPVPSILVGLYVEEPLLLPGAPQVPGEPLAGNAFGFEDFAAREELRDQDAALFDGLVEAGAFDPPEDEIARALQVELQRINCYTSGVDGAWGPGSQRALAEYYAQVGVPTPDADADVNAFREVIARNDVRCPEPVVRTVAQPVRTTQPAPAQSTRSTAPAAAPAAPAPAAAPAATAEPARRTINQTGGTGVFR